eukprot:1763756-Amphidinium_carterae.2
MPCLLLSLRIRRPLCSPRNFAVEKGSSKNTAMNFLAATAGELALALDRVCACRGYSRRVVTGLGSCLCVSFPLPNFLLSQNCGLSGAVMARR